MKLRSEIIAVATIVEYYRDNKSSDRMIGTNYIS